MTGQRTQFFLSCRETTISYLTCVSRFFQRLPCAALFMWIFIAGSVLSSLASWFLTLTVFNALQPLMFENIVMETLHMLREIAISGDTEKRKVN